ncbi:MAG: prolipoprotein diacylglyceryl transferase [Patescibacteria group bacterium]
MTHWFADLVPQRHLIAIDFFQVHWYGVLVVGAIVVVYMLIRRLYLRDHENDRDIVDLIFQVVVFGLIGARFWHVFVFQWGYYSLHLAEILMLWRGGIAIQGALLAGVLTTYFFAKRRKLSVWKLLDYLAVPLPLGQAIGRWGNFFNQELYGKPTDAPWGIFIEPENRLSGFENVDFYHPAFFYESLLSFIFFYLLWRLARKRRADGFLVSIYLVGYGVIRFVVDFIRIDPMPAFSGLRLSQWISMVFIFAGAAFLIQKTAHQPRGRPR